jgi:hypothetical protein
MQSESGGRGGKGRAGGERTLSRSSAPLRFCGNQIITHSNLRVRGQGRGARAGIDFARRSHFRATGTPRVPPKPSATLWSTACQRIYQRWLFTDSASAIIPWPSTFCFFPLPFDEPDPLHYWSPLFLLRNQFKPCNEHSFGRQRSRFWSARSPVLLKLTFHGSSGAIKAS